VLVARNGVLVYERYFTGEDEKFGQPLGAVAYDAGKLYDVRSVTKSIVSLGIGIAIERGLFPSVDAPVFSLFPEYADLRTPEKDAITLQHLLTMSAGFAWNESVPYSDPRNSEVQMYNAADPIRHVLAQPLATQPGRVYDYDVARIGQLVLSRGAWQGKQIVPAAWIDQSFTPQINGEGLFFYGYQWWLGRTLVARQEVSWAAAVGWGGQRMFVVPSRGLVVVVHAGLYRSPIFQGSVGNAVLNGHVLPALQR
jgi:CubicO group peptidase (beta-lactamase class C family)